MAKNFALNEIVEESCCCTDIPVDGCLVVSVRCEMQTEAVESFDFVPFVVDERMTMASAARYLRFGYVFERQRAGP